MNWCVMAKVSTRVKVLLFLFILIMGLTAGELAFGDEEGWQVIDTPIGSNLSIDGSKVALVNQSGAVHIVGSTIGTLRIEQDAEGNTLVVYIDSDCEIDHIQVRGSIYLKIAPDSTVASAQVENDGGAFVDGKIGEVNAGDNTYVQVIGSVDRLNVEGNAFVDVLANAVVGEANFSEAGQDASVLNVANGGGVNAVSVKDTLVVGGQGYVNQVTVGDGASVNIDATITREDGVRTEVKAPDGVQVGYIDDELLVMYIEPVGNLSLTDAADVPVKVLDLMGYPVNADITVKSSDPGVVAASFSGGSVHLERKGDGKAVITLTAKLAGYRDAKYAFSIYKNGDTSKVIEGLKTAQPDVTVKTVALDIGNVSNKGMLVGDETTILGLSTEKDALVSMVSSNERVAEVIPADDNRFTIRAKEEGMTAITITATKKSTDAVTYLPGIKKFLVLVDRKDTKRTQLAVVEPSAAALTKVYDGTTDAVIQFGEPANIQPGDDVKLGVKAFYADSNSGEGKTLYISFQLYGRNADKYIAPADKTMTNAVIKPRPVMVTASAVDREYVENVPQVLLKDFKLIGAVRGDDVRLSTRKAIGSMADPFVGVNKPVTLNLIFLNGLKADNYSLTFSKATTVTIAKQQVQAPGEATNLVYSGFEQYTQIVENPVYAATGNAAVDVGVYTATVSFLDPANYRWAGSDSEPIHRAWSISARTLANSFVAIAAVPQQTYTGSAITPKPVVTDTNRGVQLVEGVDFVYSYADNVQTGTATITVTGKGNYAGSVSATCVIASKEMTASNVSIAVVPEQTYTGSAITPKPVVTDTDRGVELVEGVDFDYSYANNTETGTATVTVTGKGNYAGSVSATFVIASKGMTASNASIASVADQTYTGSAITPKPVVTDTDRGVELVEGVDFDYTYENNTETGTATITVTGRGNYTGSVGTTFTIAAKGMTASNMSIAAVADQTYIGSTITPKPVVTDTDRDVQLVEGVDFDYTYENNTETGIANVTVTGKGNYAGSVSATFTIASKTMTASDVSIAAVAQQTYTGSPITPKPVVTDTDRGAELVEGLDFDYTYENNTETGTATVTVTGKGNYAGSMSAMFAIVSKSMAASGVSIAAVTYQIYNGSSISPKPAVTDTDRNVQMVEGVDFTYAYVNNTAAGTATITVTGKGNYSGSKNTTFTIGKEIPTLAFTSASSGNAGTTISLTTSTNSPGAVTYSVVSGTTNTSVSGSTLTLGQAGSVTVRATMASTANYESATTTKDIEIVGVKPTLLAVTGTPGTTSASFDSNARTSVALNASYNNPSGSAVSVYYTIRRIGSTGSFVYANGSTNTTARMAVGSYTLTVYAFNDYGYDKRSTTVTVSPAASNASNSGSSAGYGATLTFNNPNPSLAITGFSFSFTTASGHNGGDGDTWYVRLTHVGGSTSTYDDGTASTGVSGSYSGLNLNDITEIEFHYEVNHGHDEFCLGTNMTYSVSQVLPQNNNQDSGLDNADAVEDGLENPPETLLGMMPEDLLLDGLMAEEPTLEPTETPEPTLDPTATPDSTLEPTETPEPTLEPTVTPEPTLDPTETPEPTLEPTEAPEPTLEPTEAPEPTLEPTATPEPTPGPLDKE